MADASPAPRRWMLWLPLAFFGAIVAVVLAGLLRPTHNEVPSQMIGQHLPAFTLRPALTSPTTLARPGLADGDLATGHPHLLNIFASWCVPCVAEAPVLAGLAAHGAQIDGIAIRDHPQDLAAFLGRAGNPYARIGADDVGAVQLAIGSSGVPETFVVDGKGVIRYQHIGEIRADDVPMMLARLAEAGQ